MVKANFMFGELITIDENIKLLCYLLFLMVIVLDPHSEGKT